MFSAKYKMQRIELSKIQIHRRHLGLFVAGLQTCRLIFYALGKRLLIIKEILYLTNERFFVAGSSKESAYDLTKDTRAVKTVGGS